MIPAPRCSVRKCRHYQGFRSVRPEQAETDVNNAPVCPAFPEGIPSEIAYGDNLHSVRMMGQHGDLVFEVDQFALDHDAVPEGVLSRED